MKDKVKVFFTRLLMFSPYVAIVLNLIMIVLFVCVLCVGV